LVNQTNYIVKGGEDERSLEADAILAKRRGLRVRCGPGVAGDDIARHRACAKKTRSMYNPGENAVARGFHRALSDRPVVSWQRIVGQLKNLL